MIRPHLSIALAAVLTALPTASAQNNLTLVKDGRSDYVIVLPENPTPATSRGALELQKYLAEMSGATLPIVDDAASLPPHAILVGPGRYTGPLDAPALGNDGFVIRTKGSTLIIAGPGPRAPMYGCSTFLESLGVRWFTPKVTLVPKLPTITLAPLDTTQVPAFEYREPFFTEAFDKDWAARNKLVGNFQNLDASTGGKTAYAIFVHSFDQLIPPTLYAQHPEYFPLIDGKRATGYVQRCLTNPDVLTLAIAGVKQAFKDLPDAVICSVSQNDCYSWCQCEPCQALTKTYGAHSGLYLWFVNQVAQAIEKDFPDKLIDTLAYQFTEAPPTGIVPRKNVRIRLCPIAVCESHAYETDDFPATKAYIANLAAWSTITDSLYIWHYNTDFAHYLMPFPDFAEFPADARLYKRSGVKGIFFQGDCAPGGGGSDAELRSYVMAKLLWDTAADTDALVSEWMQGVYGPAWTPMRRWFDLLHEQVKNPANHLGIYDPPKPEIFTPDLLTQGDQLFDQAQSLAKTPLQREYIKKGRLGLRYVKLVQSPRADDALTSFLADLKEFGITSIREGQPLEHWEQAYRAQPALKK